MLVVLMVSVLGALPPVIVPHPNDISIQEGKWTLGSLASIGYDSSVEGAREVATLAATQLRLVTGYDLPLATSSVSSGIQFSGVEGYGDEEYDLIVTSTVAKISATKRSGLFYGLQTLYQLLPAQVVLNTTQTVPWVAPQCTVHDKPRFTWRGLMVDVGRHFHSLTTLKAFVRHMSRYKMNVLHWHLTEDQGWRIESKKFPALTSVGSIRDSSPKKWHRTEQDGIPYGPFFYTQEEIKELVAFAHEYSVTVVPEFEMPGHSVCAISGYPQYSCTGGPFKPRTTWGVAEDVFCPGNDATLKFIEEYLDEFLPLFDSTYVHLGGDECPKERWKACPKCQARIKKEGLKDEAELQSWFVNHFANYLDSKGRRMIGWDEILEGGLPEKAAVMSWHGSSGGQAAAKAGHNVVMTPGDAMYLDHGQVAINDTYEYISGLLPVHVVHEYNPTAGIDEKYWKYVLGVQGNLWAEYIWGRDDLEWKAFSRGAALAEVQWTDLDKKDWTRFASGLARVEYERLKLSGINAAPLALGPSVGWESGKIPSTWQTTQWTVTGSLNSAGSYEVMFVYTSGQHGLKVKNVKLFIGGYEIGSDDHEGLAFEPSEANIWSIHTTGIAGSQEVVIAADIQGDGSTDSNGRVLIYHT
jgi:hexosaminidase